MDLITQIFEVCIIPLLGILTTFFVKWVNTKSGEIQTNISDVTLKKYTNMLTSTITDCVIATNQTYVESLKAQGKFDAEAQKQALQKTTEAVMSILSDEAKAYLSAAVGDLDSWIANKIEAEVNLSK
jgi:ABC-type sulfate transport system substrate-binding protein